jgi:hypothetical protein
MDQLDVPQSPDDLYLARGTDVGPFRPILQGDVFGEIEIPGVDPSDDGLAMVIGHACSMRSGAHLRTHLLMARVLPKPAVPLERWADGYFGQMLLPELTGHGTHYAALFEMCGRVATPSLALQKRVACLDSRGIMLLQQRIAFHHTRVAVGLAILHEVSASVLEEADLLEEWLESFAKDAQPDLAAALLREEEEFDKLMSSERNGVTLRRWLGDPSERAMVRRVVREARSTRLRPPGA